MLDLTTERRGLQSGPDGSLTTYFHKRTLPFALVKMQHAIMGRMMGMIGYVALAATASCGPVGDRDAGTAPSPKVVRPKPVTPQFTEMTKADILRFAMGCLQSPPYPIDGGPMCLRPDGSSIVYSGWGNPMSRFRIAGNKVIIQEPPSVMPRDTWKIAFFRNRDGAMFIRHERLGDDDRLQPFKPYPEDEYHKWIGSPVPPPG